MTFKPRATLLPDSFSNSVTGTTTNTYASALDWRSCAGWNNKSIVIANTGNTNSLTYKVYLYGLIDSDYYYLYSDLGQSEFTVDAEDTDVLHFSYGYDRIIILVKSTSSGSATTYQFDAIGNKGGSG